MATKFFIILSILVSTGSLQAQQNILKEDFAFGHEIEITDNKSMIDVTLLEDVYQVSKSSKLTDLAVFNSKNEVVPHILVTTEAKVLDVQISPESLVLFSIYSEKNGESDFSKIKISTSNKGTITEVQNSNNAAKNETVVGYLIDASGVKNSIEKFQISLDEVQENYFIKVVLEGSNDLKNWSTIESAAVLAKFEVKSEKLEKDEIQLSGLTYSYYRISWPGSSVDVKLSSVKAVFNSKKEKIEEPLAWRDVPGVKTSADKEQAVYEYDVGGYYPISSLKVQFADQNSIAKVSIEASNDKIGTWLPIQVSTFFKVIEQGAELSNLQVSFSDQSFRYWRLRLDSNVAGVGSRFPDISFGWRPHSVRFLARGEGPFTLAYGSSKTINAPQSDLINTNWTTEVGKGNLKNKIAFGGPEKLIDEEKSNYPFRKIILWSILLLGVVLLGWMALQVKKQIPPLD